MMLSIHLLIIQILAPFAIKVQADTVLPERERIASCVAQELAAHPAARLADLYKYFFQDAFGPGHLIGSRRDVAAYLDRELEEAGEFDRADYQELGYTGQFVRVNLRLVADGTISRRELLDAFLKSARDFRVPELPAWKKEWAGILEVIRQVAPDLPGLQEDSIRIGQLLNEGDYVLHHSEIYNSAYHPHYRIVGSAAFRKLMAAAGETGNAANHRN